MGRGPHKKFEDTWREKVEKKKRLMAEKKAKKDSEAREKAALREQGLCKGPRGEIGTNAEIGRIYGTNAWNTASEQ